MNKKEFEKHFRQEFLPIIREIEQENGNGVDRVMRNEEWNNVIDSMIKEGTLPDRAQDWTSPF